jgi:hypothetical protein
MPRGKSMFRKTDMVRAIKAAVAGGIAISRIEIEPGGKIVLQSAIDAKVSERNQERNEWDDVT